MINDLLTFAHESGASDLHLSAGVAPMLRINGDMCPVEHAPLTAEEVAGLVDGTMDDAMRAKFAKTQDVDYTYLVPDIVRCRVNAFVSLRGPAAVFRLIPAKTPTLPELGLPQVVADTILGLDRGLVLVTGPAGSGKTSTLAAMVELLNTERQSHILTIEDPVEFIHPSAAALVNHRELGTSTMSFARALKSALREDPDIIVIGEMRDLETIQLALTAAETGHLVLGTLHTSSAAKTVTRVIDVFPPEKQEQVRTMIAESLQLVISQTLLKRADGKGRVAAYEILLASVAVRNQIRENQIFQIPSTMEISTALGMQTLGQALERLLDEGIIAPEEAEQLQKEGEA